MTFIVGFHLIDGLVFCSDSEETDQYNKKYVDKLYHKRLLGDWDVCFGGAGDAIAIDKFKSKLFPILGSEPIDQFKAENKIEKSLSFMEKSYGHSRFSILLGLSNVATQGTFLYRTYDDHVLRPLDSGQFACIGADTSLAQFLIENVFHSLMALDEVLRIGIWATAIMKRHGHGVSGPTMAFTFSRTASKWKRHYTSEIVAIENEYPIKETQDLLFNYWKMKNSK
jgi:hypothetical protein